MVDKLLFYYGLKNFEGRKFKPKELADYIDSEIKEGDYSNGVRSQLNRAKKLGIVVSPSRGVWILSNLPKLEKAIENIPSKKAQRNNGKGGVTGLGGKSQLKGTINPHFVQFRANLEGETIHTLFIKLHDWETTHKDHNLVKSLRFQLPNGMMAKGTVNAGPRNAHIVVKIDQIHIPIVDFVEQMTHLKQSIEQYLAELYYNYKILVSDLNISHYEKKGKDISGHYAFRIPTEQYYKLRTFFRVNKDGYPTFPYGIGFLDESCKDAVYGGHAETMDADVAEAWVDNLQNAPRDRENVKKALDHQKILDERLDRLEGGTQTICRGLDLIISKIEKPEEKTPIKKLDISDYSYQ